MKRDCAKTPEKVRLDVAYLKAAAERVGEVGKKFEYLLNTGNLASRSGLDLSQAAGFTVVAEKLNFFRRALPPAPPALRLRRSRHAHVCAPRCRPIQVFALIWLGFL